SSPWAPSSLALILRLPLVDQSSQGLPRAGVQTLVLDEMSQQRGQGAIAEILGQLPQATADQRRPIDRGSAGFDLAAPITRHAALGLQARQRLVDCRRRDRTAAGV